MFFFVCLGVFWFFFVCVCVCVCVCFFCCCSVSYFIFNHTHISTYPLILSSVTFKLFFFSKDNEYSKIFKQASRNLGIKALLLLYTFLKIETRFLLHFTVLRKLILILCLFISFISFERFEQIFQSPGKSDPALT